MVIILLDAESFRNRQPFGAGFFDRASNIYRLKCNLVIASITARILSSRLIDNELILRGNRFVFALSGKPVPVPGLGRFVFFAE